MNNRKAVKIAIVDDSPLVLQAVEKVLGNWGYNLVLKAINGKDLFRQLTPVNAPDICITDMNMPVMDGYETIRVLKEKWPGIKVMAFSGDTETEQLRQSGADIFVSKADPLSALKTALQTICQAIKRSA